MVILSSGPDSQFGRWRLVVVVAMSMVLGACTRSASHAADSVAGAPPSELRAEYTSLLGLAIDVAVDSAGLPFGIHRRAGAGTTVVLDLETTRHYDQPGRPSAAELRYAFSQRGAGSDPITWREGTAADEVRCQEEARTLNQCTMDTGVLLLGANGFTERPDGSVLVVFSMKRRNGDRVHYMLHAMSFRGVDGKWVLLGHSFGQS